MLCINQYCATSQKELQDIESIFKVGKFQKNYCEQLLDRVVCGPYPIKTDEDNTFYLSPYPPTYHHHKTPPKALYICTLYPYEKVMFSDNNCKLFTSKIEVYFLFIWFLKLKFVYLLCFGFTTGTDFLNYNQITYKDYVT